jgi:hypothetical protein
MLKMLFNMFAVSAESEADRLEATLIAVNTAGNYGTTSWTMTAVNAAPTLKKTAGPGNGANVKGTVHVAALIEAARQQLGGPIVLIWDGLPAHKSARMRAWIVSRLGER